MSSPTHKNTSLINNYAHQLRSALNELKSPSSETEIEAISIFLLRLMGSDLRDYHKPEHSIDVSRDQPPTARIAALFHDCVYVQVDPLWDHTLDPILLSFLPSKGYTVNVKAALEAQNIPNWFKTVAIVFNCENETQYQPSSGLNEFLSALVMVRKLEKTMKPLDLLKAVACIEATIPFRKVDSNGNPPSHRLKDRMQLAAKHLAISLTAADLDDTTQACRLIVESDLAGFGSESLNFFLSNTWNVMNENSASLRNTFFLVSDYRKAVYGITGFLQSINPSHMFWSDVAAGSAKNARLVERAHYNLKNGVEYLKAVSLSLSILEAIALETGGDAPFEFFVGSLKKSREHTPPGIGDFLKFEEKPSFDSDSKLDVYKILKDGRQMRNKFERKASPLGAYLYAGLQENNLFEIAYQIAAAFHKGSGTAKNLLNQLPAAMKNEILTAVSQLALTRADQINSLK